MSVADVVAPHLPFLRRFARALSGTQSAGDAYVVATLKTIVADPGVSTPGSIRELPSTSCSCANGASAPETQAEAAGAEASEKNIAAIALEPRIAFLLQALEAFSLNDIAKTLDRPEDEASALIERAGQQISAQLQTSVLIIEDEPLIAADLRSLVEQLGHEVTTVARTHDEAVRAALDRRPGLILSDIQLADGSSGLDAVNDILGAQEAPVIFITGYPELFLTGRRPSPRS